MKALKGFLIFGCTFFLTDTVLATTLDEALVAAYQASPKLDAERQQLKVVDETVPQARSNWRPTIELNGGKGYASDVLKIAGNTVTSGFVSQNPSTEYGVTVSQPLYRGGRTVAEIGAAMANVNSEVAHLWSVEEAVFLSVVTDYLDVVLYQDALKLADQETDTLNSQLRATDAKQRGGEASNLDLAQIRAALALAVAQRAQAAIKLNTARLAFLRDVGIPPGQVGVPETARELPESRETAIELATSANPDVVAARYSVTQAQRQVDDSAGAMRPTVNIQAQIQQQEEDIIPKQTEDSKSVILQIHVPLYGGGLISSQVRAAKDNVAVKRALLRQAQDTAIESAASSWDAWQSGLLAIEANKDQISADTTAVIGTRASQLAGERTILDNLNAEQTLFQAKQALLQNQHDALISMYTLLSAVGFLTSRKLKLDVVHYDENKYFNKIKESWR